VKLSLACLSLFVIYSSSRKVFGLNIHTKGLIANIYYVHGFVSIEVYNDRTPQFGIGNTNVDLSDGLMPSWSTSTVTFVEMFDVF